MTTMSALGFNTASTEQLDPAQEQVERIHDESARRHLER